MIHRKGKLTLSLYIYSSGEYIGSYVFRQIPYSRKAWQEESLLDLVNEQHFVKLKSVKCFHPIQIGLANKNFAKIFSCQVYCGKFVKISSH